MWLHNATNCGYKTTVFSDQVATTVFLGRRLTVARLQRSRIHALRVTLALPAAFVHVVRSLGVMRSRTRSEEVVPFLGRRPMGAEAGGLGAVVMQDSLFVRGSVDWRMSLIIHVATDQGSKRSVELGMHGIRRIYSRDTSFAFENRKSTFMSSANEQYPTSPCGHT